MHTAPITEWPGRRCRLERDEEVARYRRLFERAQSIASGPHDSIDLMRGLTP